MPGRRTRFSRRLLESGTCTPQLQPSGPVLPAAVWICPSDRGRGWAKRPGLRYGRREVRRSAWRRPRKVPQGGLQDGSLEEVSTAAMVFGRRGWGLVGLRAVVMRL